MSQSRKSENQTGHHFKLPLKKLMTKTEGECAKPLDIPEISFNLALFIAEELHLSPSTNLSYSGMTQSF